MPVSEWVDIWVTTNHAGHYVTETQEAKVKNPPYAYVAKQVKVWIPAQTTGSDQRQWETVYVKKDVLVRSTCHRKHDMNVPFVSDAYCATNPDTAHAFAPMSDMELDTRNVNQDCRGASEPTKPGSMFLLSGAYYHNIGF